MDWISNKRRVDDMPQNDIDQYANIVVTLCFKSTNKMFHQATN